MPLPLSRPARVTVAMLALLLVVAPTAAEACPSLIEPLRSWTQLVTSNGYTGVVVDLNAGEVTHFREHIFATEEPRWRDDGEELWLPTVPGGDCWKPLEVPSRDLLNDAYFGVAADGFVGWLAGQPVDLDASGYDATPDRDGRDGGTGIVRMVQPVPGRPIVATTRVFAPWGADWGAFVLALEVRNDGAAQVDDVRVFALINANVGYGRPGPRRETGADFETIRRDSSGAVVEQGFAGTVVVRPVGAAARVSHTPAPFFTAVRDGGLELPEPPAGAQSGDGLASAYQWNVGSIAPGGSAWVALVVAHDPNPDFDEGRLAATDAWIAGRDARQLWIDERDGWQAFQDRVTVPAGLSDDETDLYHHSATVLRMAQVRESSYWVRPESDRGVTRRTGVDGANAPVPAPGTVRDHTGAGAVLASLPPGEWAYAWVRDGAYAIVGLTDAGLHEEARAALAFFMNAHANRYIDFEELRDVPLRDYALSLTRYHGFGIEESDTTCNGDLNFEWDGFGLYLWALRHYVERTGDTSLLDEHWGKLRDGVGDVIVGLVDESGLMWPDSSIWEVHWFGDEKRFAYTNITNVRGLCDLAWLAEQRGDTALATRYGTAGRALRQQIYRQLRNPAGAIAANVEELATGTGYWDAAVIEAVGMGLFRPDGPTATRTIEALRENLTVASGCGLFRNDDEFDAHALSPYGNPYDSLEWVFLDYRMSIAARHAGLGDYADHLQTWVREQTMLNFLLIGENYDAGTGVYRNNAPMIGFGSGSYITAMRQRAGEWSVDAACGVYFEDDPLYGPDDPGPADPDPDADAGGDVGPADAGETGAGDADDGGGAEAGEDTTTGDDTTADEAEATGADATVGDDVAEADVDVEGDDAAPDGDASAGADVAPADDAAAGDDAAVPRDVSAGRDADADDPSEPRPRRGGCAVATAAAPADAPLAALALLATLWARRRRR